MSTKQLDAPPETSEEYSPQHQEARDQRSTSLSETTVAHDKGSSESSLQEQEPAVRPAADEHVEEHHKISRSTLILMGVGLIILLAAMLVLGIVPRIRRDKKNAASAKDAGNAVAVVNVISTQRSAATSNLELPGNVEAIQVTSVNARTNGYLKRWYVDLGDRVRRGQLLAEIDAPEAQQEVEQARSNLNQARAGLGQTQANLQQARTNAEFARVTYARWSYLVGQGVVSKQDADEKRAAYDAAQATVNAQLANIKASQATISANEANVRRLVELQGYQKLYAPFSGVVTARFIDNGALIGSSAASAGVGAQGGSGATANGASTSTSGGAAGGGGALFSIARIDTLRVYVSVPQTFFQSIRVGQLTNISVRELPARTFTGRVVRTANALDPTSRTLLAEVQIDNRDYALIPGMYADVKFDVKLPIAPVRVPATALIVRADGTQVATITSDEKIHFQKVEVGRDYGKTIDIIDGLEEGALLVVDPTASLNEGQAVKVNYVKDSSEDQGKDKQDQGGAAGGSQGQGAAGAGQPGGQGSGGAQGPGGQSFNGAGNNGGSNNQGNQPPGGTSPGSSNAGSSGQGQSNPSTGGPRPSSGNNSSTSPTQGGPGQGGQGGQGSSQPRSSTGASGTGKSSSSGSRP